jgi:hypothetical protein
LGRNNEFFLHENRFHLPDEKNSIALLYKMAGVKNLSMNFDIVFVGIFFQGLKKSFFIVTRTLDAYTDPCLPQEYHEQSTHKGRKYHFIGTGDFIQCQKNISPLLNTSVHCHKAPCSFNGVYQPDNSNSDSEFYGFSEYWYSMHDVLRIGGHYQADKMTKAAKVSYCNVQSIRICPIIYTLATK